MHDIAMSFVEGTGLILTPSVLPILPVLLAVSLEGNRRRPLGVGAGFVVTFVVLTIISSEVYSFLRLDASVVQYIALGVLALFGVMMISDRIAEKLSRAARRVSVNESMIFSDSPEAPPDSFAAEVAMGALIGLVWVPCGGVQMGQALAKEIQSTISVETLADVFAFSAGIAVPLLAILAAGRIIFDHSAILKKQGELIHRTLGIVVIAVALMSLSGKYAGEPVAFSFDSAGGQDASSDATAQLALDSVSLPSTMRANRALRKGLENPYAAPELTLGEWVNPRPLKIADLRGKVVLLDFWTHSCANCLKDLPHLAQWHEKYGDKGLVVIGIHSPEFDFEKNAEDVKAIIEKHGIRYPVLLDAKLETWGVYKNRYWPSRYLIDKNGSVVYSHYGESDYDALENNIRTLLDMPQQLPQLPSHAKKASVPKTPETHLGYLRAERYVGQTPITNDAVIDYYPADPTPLNSWTLCAPWKVKGDRIVSSASESSMRLTFRSRRVFLVMGTSTGRPEKATLRLNEDPIGNMGGKDVKNGVVTVKGPGLYELVDQGVDQEGQLDIIAHSPGLELFVFTFGD